MKRILLSFITLFISLSLLSQTVIEMEKSGGVYKVPCEVNGLRMKFIFDTGASHVCLSESMASFMYENGYLKSDDIVGKSQSRVADGRIVDDIRIVLHDIEIAGLHLKDVDAKVSSGQSAPLLLGQSAIQKLGVVTIDGNKLIINTMSDEDKDRIIEQLEESANDNYSNQRYKAAIDDLLQIEKLVGLSAHGLMELCVYYECDHDYSNCLIRSKEWLEKYEFAQEEKEDRSVIYCCLGDSYQVLNNPEKSILYYQKALNDDKYVHTDKEDIFFTIAMIYDEQEKWDDAYSYYKKSLEEHYKTNKASKEKVMAGLYKDEDLGATYFNLCRVLIKLGREGESKTNMVLAAKCGNKTAIEGCERFSLNYNTKTNPTPVRNKGNRRR